MMTRKQFLKSASIALAGVAPLSGVLSGCAPAAFSIHAQVLGNIVRVPLAGLPDLHRPDAYVKVYVERITNPFIVFASYGHEIVAVLSTCSHNGCEVRKLRTKFECPCHGSEYDLSGNVTRGPAPEPLQRFSVREVGDNLEFSL